MNQCRFQKRRSSTFQAFRVWWRIKLSWKFTHTNLPELIVMWSSPTKRRYTHRTFSRWWQLKYLLYSPQSLAKWCNSTFSYFSDGLEKNHQLVFVCFCMSGFVSRSSSLQVWVGQRLSASKLICTLVVAAERRRQGSLSSLVYWKSSNPFSAHLGGYEILVFSQDARSSGPLRGWWNILMMGILISLHLQRWNFGRGQKHPQWYFWCFRREILWRMYKTRT